MVTFSKNPPSTASSAIPASHVMGFATQYRSIHDREFQLRMLDSLAARIIQLEIAMFLNPALLAVPNFMGLQLEAIMQFVMETFSTTNLSSSLFRHTASSSQSIMQSDTTTFLPSMSIPSLFQLVCAYIFIPRTKHIGFGKS